MNNFLTDRNYWKTYWQHYQYNPIPSSTFFDAYCSTGKGKQFIEIGGFPGTMSIYFTQKYQYDAKLLDFYIDHEMIHKLESVNQLKPGTIKCIEHDFFTYDSQQTYDMVFSLGFIEHFDDTQDVIQRHLNLLNSQGKLLIILPNFRGINGWLQKYCDRPNYDAHNLESMKINKLKEIMKQLGHPNAQVEYTRKPMLWLEPKPTRTNQFARKLVKVASHALKLFPIKSRLLSPYIVIHTSKEGTA